jgi:hypothetical protein
VHHDAALGSLRRKQRHDGLRRHGALGHAAEGRDEGRHAHRDLELVRVGRDALRGPQRPALPAGTTFASAVTGAALEDDEAMRKVAGGVGRPDPEVEAGQGRPKRSESGVGYDTTAEVVLTPADDASLRNAGKNGMTKTAPMDEAAAAVRAEAAARKARRAGGGAGGRLRTFGLLG